MWGHEIQAGTTVYFDSAKTFSAATTAYFEMHSNKKDQDLKVGTLLTLEGGAAYNVPTIGGAFGVGYYLQAKLSDDTGADVPIAALRPQLVRRNRLFGVGPDVTMAVFQKGGTIGLVNARYLWNPAKHVSGRHIPDWVHHRAAHDGTERVQPARERTPPVAWRARKTVDSKGADGMSSDDKRHRSHLPMPNTGKKGLITFDAKDPASKFPPIDRLRPPTGAPNVLIVLIDDVGFGATSAFGGPCQTPTAEKLAAGGLKFNRFHTTALCSPTRQALLTGRNHHSVGMGGITEIATGAPGYCSVLPNSMSPLARTLKLNGYSTAQFGKCHEVPVWETSPAGPFDAWPTGGGGFEYFYGFIGGEANQWYPTLYEGTTPVEPGKTPEEGYHLMEDMTDKAIGWIGQQKSLAPDKPFFIYFAPGATHAPHHVPKEWADKYKGKFDQGWDKLREETFARQKKLGVIPQDCQLTPRHKEIPAWDEMPEGFKPVLRREMEVYAGFLEYTDHHIGRLVDSLGQPGHRRQHAHLLHRGRQRGLR